jgi:hypothetical protein
MVILVIFECSHHCMYTKIGLTQLIALFNLYSLTAIGCWLMDCYLVNDLGRLVYFYVASLLDAPTMTHSKSGFLWTTGAFFWVSIHQKRFFTVQITLYYKINPKRRSLCDPKKSAFWVRISCIDQENSHALIKWTVTQGPKTVQSGQSDWLVYRLTIVVFWHVNQLTQMH